MGTSRQQRRGRRRRAGFAAAPARDHAVRPVPAAPAPMRERCRPCAAPHPARRGGTTVDFPLFGGAGSSAMCVFDGARWSVLATIGAPPLRQDPALAFDPVRGTVLMCGGNGPGFPTGTPLGDTWELVGNTWLQLAVTGPPPRKGARL